MKDSIDCNDCLIYKRGQAQKKFNHPWVAEDVSTPNPNPGGQIQLCPQNGGTAGNCEFDCIKSIIFFKSLGGVLFSLNSSLG